MKYGINIICFIGRNQKKGIEFHIECAEAAEDAGWDGFFIWDHIWGFWNNHTLKVVDPWIILSAVAARTKRIKLGPMVTPLARRRPWKVARETVTLDHLSKGRLILGVGLGGTCEEFGLFNEPTEAKIRAEKLDESLEILTGLWEGKPFSYNGKHYNIKELTFLPKPLQEPRIPIWVAGYWPNKLPFYRAAKYDGVVPAAEFNVEFGPDKLREVLKIIKKKRGSLEGFEVVGGGTTTGINTSKDTEVVQPWLEAGATWFMEHITDWIGTEAELLARIQRGPPSVV